MLHDLLTLYTLFFRMGAVTFGGGYAMLPILQREGVENKHWATEEELTDYFAIGQCTPGIIAVNVSTFVGYKRKGIPGAIISTLGMISPSLIIVSILAMFVQQFIENPYVAHAVGGIKVVVCALMLNTVITMGKKSMVSKITIAMALIGFALAMFTPIPTVFLVIFAGIIGIVLYKMGRLKV